LYELQLRNIMKKEIKKLLDKQFKYVSQVYRISFKDSLEGNRYRYLLEQLSYRMADTIREIDEQIS